MSLYGEEGYAHTVCVFVDEKGLYNVINQDKTRYTRASSLEALGSVLYPAWTLGILSEQTGTRGRLVKQITNLHPTPPTAFDPFADLPT